MRLEHSKMPRRSGVRPTYLSSVQIEEQRGNTAGGGGQKRSVATRDRHTGRHGRRGFHTWLIRKTPLEPDKDMKLNFLTVTASLPSMGTRSNTHGTQKWNKCGGGREGTALCQTAV